MQPSTLLLAIVASFGLGSVMAHPESLDSHLEKRRCFMSGEKYGDQRDIAFTKAREACNDYFVGNYEKGKTYKMCKNLSNSKSIEFKVGLTGDHPSSTRYLGEDECYDGLKKQIAHCDRGGEKKYGNWEYRADPNKGHC